MDYTKIPRILIYNDEIDIERLPIDVEGSMQNVFYTKLVERPFIMESGEAAEMTLKIFNNANYLSKLINLEKHPRLYLKKYLKIAEGTQQDSYPYLEDTPFIVKMNHMMPATMALVCNLLSLHGGNKYIDFIKLICKNFDDWDVKGAIEGKVDFFTLILTGDKYKAFLADGVDYFFMTRSIANISLDDELSPQDIAKGIDYIVDKIYAESENDEDGLLLYRLFKRKLDEYEGNENDIDFIHAQKELLNLTRYMNLNISSIEQQESQTATSLEIMTKELEEEREKYKKMEKHNEQLNTENIRLKEQLAQRPAVVDDNEKEELRDEIEDLKAEIEHLNNTNSHISAKQAAILTITACYHAGKWKNRENLHPILTNLLGIPETHAKRRLREGIKEKDAEELAQCFEDVSPMIARIIREMPEKLKSNK